MRCQRCKSLLAHFKIKGREALEECHAKLATPHGQMVLRNQAKLDNRGITKTRIKIMQLVAIGVLKKIMEHFEVNDNICCKICAKSLPKQQSKPVCSSFPKQLAPSCLSHLDLLAEIKRVYKGKRQSRVGPSRRQRRMNKQEAQSQEGSENPRLQMIPPTIVGAARRCPQQMSGNSSHLAIKYVELDHGLENEVQSKNTTYSLTYENKFVCPTSPVHVLAF